MNNSAAPARPWAAELLFVWFHKLRPAQRFAVSPATDEMLRRRFARDLRALRRRPPAEFMSDPQTALAAVLLFDQVPRNLHRGSAQAFAQDRLARSIAKGALALGFAPGLTREQQQFLAMPLMHSEAKVDQLASLAIFGRLGPRFGLPYARSHARVVLRFGRFPHRNTMLGRKSSPAERRAVAQGAAW